LRTPLRTTSKALSLTYTIYSSPLSTHYCPQASLVISLQRISTLTVTTTHIVSSFHCPTAKIRDSLHFLLQLPTISLSSLLSYLLRLNSLLTAHVELRNSTDSYDHFDLFITPRCGSHIKHSCSIVALIRLRGYVFTQFFHSNNSVRHISFRHNSSIFARGHYLVTAVLSDSTVLALSKCATILILTINIEGQIFLQIN
jgi:hypothetical protein